ncbi:MAG: DUF1501 domain-containing protein [Planctomycetaceae bacterium]
MKSFEDRRHWGLPRRTFVGRLGVSALGWDLWRRIAAAEGAPPRPARIGIEPVRACIFVFYYGGPSHLDTYDMKPLAPAEVRGEFQPIATSVPGLAVCEHLPHMAGLMHKVALVRSMHHTNRLHDSASIETFTGRQGPEGDREEFAPIRQHIPCHGAVLHALRKQLPCDVHHAVLPWLFHNVIDVPCQGGGFLGHGYDPLRINGDAQSLTFSASLLSQPPGLSLGRIDQRRHLLESIDERTASDSDASLTGFYERAYELIESDQLRHALQIDQEGQQTRERYGVYENTPQGQAAAAALAYGRNMRGQSLLQARRLVEAGIPFVNVNDFRQQGQNWDAHNDNFGQHKDYLLPQADRALSALLEDLDERGLLDSTLVVALGEFGRTPRINGNAGRDHWPDCYTILLAGGGIRGGSVYGASDAHGAFPDLDPVTPADLAATIYWRFGLDPRREIHDTTGRPYRLSDGQPLTQLFS